MLSKLAGLSKGRKALARPLKEAETPEAAWDLARAVAPFAKGDPKTWGDELFAVLEQRGIDEEKREHQQAECERHQHLAHHVTVNNSHPEVC